jgi:hypothetical protein
VKIIFKKALGVILIIVGLAALLTPLTPGSWLALIGLELLGIRQWVFRKFMTEKQRMAVEKFMLDKFKFASKKKSAGKNENKQP